MVEVSAVCTQNNRYKNPYLYSALGAAAITGSSYLVGNYFDNKNKKAEQSRFKEEQDKFEKVYNDKKQNLEIKIDELTSQLAEPNKNYETKHQELTTKIENLSKKTFSEEVNSLRNALLISFPDKVKIAEQGGKNKIPQCILVTGKDKEMANLLMNWIKTRLKYTTNTVITDANTKVDDIFECVEDFTKNEADPEKFSRWQLLHLQDWDQYVIKGMPGSDTAYSTMSDLRDFNTTLMFYAEDYLNLVENVTQPHRINFIYSVDAEPEQGFCSRSICLTNHDEMKQLLKKETDEMNAQIELCNLKRDPKNDELAKLKKELPELKCEAANPIKLTKNCWKGLGIGVLISILGITILNYKNKQTKAENKNDKTNQ